MRWTILAFCMILGTAGAAAAAPVAGGASVAPDANIQLASGGCGPYGFRDYYGYCRQRPVYAGPRPRFYGCPRGFRPTPFGCRPYY